MVMMIANRMIYQMKQSAKQSGFTLQELVISLAIMGIIATGAVSNYKVEQKTSLVEQASADVDGLTQAYNQFYTKTGAPPHQLMSWLQKAIMLVARRAHGVLGMSEQKQRMVMRFRLIRLTAHMLNTLVISMPAQVFLALQWKLRLPYLP